MDRWNREGRKRGQRPDVELVTLGKRHSGSIRTDLKTTQSAWARLRARLHLEDGEALPFFRVNECTDGTDEMGHVHAHVVVVWPFRDLRKLDGAWTDATNGEAVNVDVQGRKKARTRGVSAAASYAAAYVSKQGCSTRSLELRAQWYDALAAGSRLYSTSRGLLSAQEPSCSCPECKGSETVLSIERRIPPRYRLECVPAPPMTARPNAAVEAPF